MSDPDLERKVREAAEIIRRRAIDLTRPWSWRIPASLLIQRDGDAAFKVVADSDIAPHARAYEYGLRHRLNYPSQREAKKGQPWGNTPHRPFLAQAVDDEDGKVVEKVAEVIETWTYKMGFK